MPSTQPFKAFRELQNAVFKGIRGVAERSGKLEGMAF